MLQTKVKQEDGFDIDPLSLEQSYNPSSKKEIKEEKLVIPDAKKIEASSVDIVMPSSQSLNEINKY